MSNYAYVAFDPNGFERRGSLDVADQSEALKRIKEMGLFPTKLRQKDERRREALARAASPARGRVGAGFSKPLLPRRIKPAHLAVFTRQLATLIQAGMPLLRGLRTLQEQEENPVLKRIVGELALAIENGSSFAEAVAAHPKVFNRLFVNMVKAGEIGGALETTLQRLAEFMEKAQKIKGKIQSALAYPCAVMVIAFVILIVLTVFIVPRFREVFDGFLNGKPLPAFTVLVFAACETVKNNLLLIALAAAALIVLASMSLRTTSGRLAFDRLTLAAPTFGPLFKKSAISRFARTLGTLVSNGVPILQALAIVKETAGNVAVGRVIAALHDAVKQGEPLAPTLRGSGLFPAMVAGMVDVGEQTGALPEMLMKIADTYDDQVDTAAGALTSLLEPILLVVLAVVVGSIVLAMFLPLIAIIQGGFDSNGAAGN